MDLSLFPMFHLPPEILAIILRSLRGGHESGEDQAIACCTLGFMTVCQLWRVRIQCISLVIMTDR